MRKLILALAAITVFAVQSRPAEAAVGCGQPWCAIQIRAELGSSLTLALTGSDPADAETMRKVLDRRVLAVIPPGQTVYDETTTFCGVRDEHCLRFRVRAERTLGSAARVFVSTELVQDANSFTYWLHLYNQELRPVTVLSGNTVAMSDEFTFNHGWDFRVATQLRLSNTFVPYYP